VLRLLNQGTNRLSAYNKIIIFATAPVHLVNKAVSELKIKQKSIEIEFVCNDDKKNEYARLSKFLHLYGGNNLNYDSGIIQGLISVSQKNNYACLLVYNNDQKTGYETIEKIIEKLNTNLIFTYTVKESIKCYSKSTWKFNRKYIYLKKELKRKIKSESILIRYNSDKYKRKIKYRRYIKRKKEYSEISDKLKIDGYAKIKNVIDKDCLIKIKEEFDSLIIDGDRISRPFNNVSRKDGDRSQSRNLLNEAEFKKGQKFYRDKTNYVSLVNPLVSIPSISNIAFKNIFINIASEYFNCFPGLSSVVLRKDFVNKLPLSDFNYFHSDPSSPRLLKYFFYLSDVDLNGGGLCYVRGSHNKKFKGWDSKYRWTRDEIENIYGSLNILSLTGNVGDVIVADVTGFHCAGKPVTMDRTTMVTHFVVHEEWKYVRAKKDIPKFSIPNEQYALFDERQKAASDFLRILN